MLFSNFLIMKTKTLLIIWLLLLAIISWPIISAKLLPISDRAKDVSNMDKSPIIEKVDDHVVLTPPWLEKKVFIHYAKPWTVCWNNVCEAWENAKKCPADCWWWATGDTTCYGFLWKGVKWKDFPQDYIINPTNEDGLTESFIVDKFNLWVEEWDSNTTTNLLANYSVDYNATWDDQTPDWRNEIVFWNYQDEWVIWVTVVWWYYSWSPKNRKIVEFDMLLNDNYTWWDADIDSSLMDFQNIAIHELWHGLWLDDLYTSSCIEETMYWYSDNWETTKRSLNSWDIAGLQSLYWN